MTDVVIIDSGGANLASLQFALQRLGAASVVSTDITVIRGARRVLLPGVGAAADAMQRLRTLTQPLLGICLGMQLLYTRSDEGGTDCLGIIDGTVRRLTASDELPVPHMGWNTCEALTTDPLLSGLSADDYFYFVHGYAALPGTATVATVDYGQPLTAIVRHRNFCGVQFHPERSARAGARLLRNFLDS
jgi:glutamine amidotransferase